MTLTTSSLVSAPRDRVFAALVDPETLRRVIPGCESLEATGADTYEAKLKIGVAGMNGVYTGHAAVRDKNPPDSLTLAFDGKGGPGFVRGTAAVSLADENGSTRITSRADVQVGGLIAAVGSRLVEAASRKLSDEFFTRLNRELSASS
jgi:carbon monoxide dehydrogenase subunit G